MTDIPMTDMESSRTQVAAGATEQDEESTAAKLRQQASDVASAGTQEVQHVAATAKQEASAVVDDAGRQARRVVSEATSQLRRQGDEQVQRLAGTVGDLSQELRRMSAAGGDGTAAGLASEAAGMLDRLGGRLMQGGLDGAVNDLKRYARNRPGVFLAAAVGAGFVAGRLVRNTDRSALTGSQPDGDRAWQAPPASGLVTGPASTQYPSSKPSPSATQAAAITPYPGPDERREPGSR